ncbi:MAG: polynucleotide adenylyltransferase [Kiritimatiellae bacterium]|nr:polynucleotide adenylyltransferase [Kiritimatiellia bacterium]
MIYKQLDLSVLKQDLRKAVLTVAEMVRDAGGRALMVGGSVRDLALGVASVKDVDVEVFGIEPARLQELLSHRFRVDPCGLSFGVLKLESVEMDISIPRRETKRGIGHKGFLIDSDPNLSIREAACRRDFTINAMYYDPLEGIFEDPYGGMNDLRDHRLRHVSEQFAEDPLRVLRGMQFIARFDLYPAPETIEICRSISMEDLPPERLFGEWSKLLTQGKQIGRGLQFLRETGWVRYFPELQHLIGCKQDPKWHPEGDVWNHTCLCLDAFARDRTGERDEDLIVGLAVLCHDFGKPFTTEMKDGHLRSFGHDEAGVKPTLDFLRRLTNEERLLREVPPLVQYHMQPFALWRAKAGDSAIRRLAAKVIRIDRLLRVAHADDQGRTPELAGGSSNGEDLRWLDATAERLRIAASAPKPILMGRDLIAMGYTPSVQFGIWLDACFEAQLDGAFFDREGAIAYFKERFGK